MTLKWIENFSLMRLTLNDMNEHILTKLFVLCCVCERKGSVKCEKILLTHNETFLTILHYLFCTLLSFLSLLLYLSLIADSSTSNERLPISLYVSFICKFSFHYLRTFFFPFSLSFFSVTLACAILLFPFLSHRLL